jgi:hypothetical protein
MGPDPNRRVRENGPVSNPYAPPSPDRTPDGSPAQDGERAPGPAAPPRDGGPHGGGPQAGPPPAGPPRAAAGRAPHPGATPPPPAPTPPPEVLARIGRLVRQFGVWLVAGVVVGLLPLPWRLATVAFLVGAGWAGVRALVAVGTARLRGGLLPLLTAGLVMVGILLVGTFGSLLTWDLDTERQACLQGALTRSAEAACERDYRDGLDDLSGGLTGGLTGTP